MYSIMFTNFIYAVISIIIGIVAGRLAVKFMDKTTPYDTIEQLKKGNKAVGIVVAGVYLGVSIMVGLIIGLSVN